MALFKKKTTVQALTEAEALCEAADKAVADLRIESEKTAYLVQSKADEIRVAEDGAASLEQIEALEREHRQLSREAGLVGKRLLLAEKQLGAAREQLADARASDLSVRERAAADRVAACAKALLKAHAEHQKVVGESWGTYHTRLIDAMPLSFVAQWVRRYDSRDNPPTPKRSSLVTLKFVKVLEQGDRSGDWNEHLSAYATGDVAGFQPGVAQRLIDMGYAVRADQAAEIPPAAVPAPAQRPAGLVALRFVKNPGESVRWAPFAVYNVDDRAGFAPHVAAQLVADGLCIPADRPEVVPDAAA